MTLPHTATAAADYLFDLDGYVLLKQTLSPSEVSRLNATLDGFPATAPGGWHGRVQRQDHDEQRGINWQNVTEGGPPFEELIDHPAWIRHVCRWVGNRQSLWIDEAFANVRGPGGAINVHGGATAGDGAINYHGQYHHDNGVFHCGQVNVLVALTYIGPGDGATCLVPCSHKSSLTHPAQTGVVARAMDDGGLMVGATEIHMRAGDAAVFVDSLAHGSVRRSNPEERRTVVYRYCPSLRRSRFGYRPSAELLARLTPERAALVSRGAPAENLPPEALREELEALPLEELRKLLRAKEAKL